LETDDGTSDHFPSGTVLTSFTDNNPIGHGGKNCQCLYTFDKPASLTAGTLYHLHFTNPDPDPKTNFVSINNLFIDPPAGFNDRLPAGNITDLALLTKISAPQWSIFTDQNTPIFTLYYSSGDMQGQSYMATGVNSGVRTINGTNYKVRSNIIVSGSNRTVNKVWVRLKKITGTDNLIIRLEDSGGELIEGGTVSASDIKTSMSWVSLTFSTAHILLSGHTYNLVLSTGSGTTYQTYHLYDGGYGYGFKYMFSDGHIEYTTNGSTWNNPGQAEKAHIYFETIGLDTLKYLGSTIENATSSFLDMTFSLILADTIPSSAAFKVKVNGSDMPVNSVSISGNKVRLMLLSPVVYNDIVTVSYNIPPKKWLRPVSGEEAPSFNDQPVTNKCLDPAKPNEPPVPVLNYKTSGYSGFIYEIDASGSKDPEGEILAFQWIVPPNVPVSSASNSKIQFLAPIVNTSQDMEFQLRINDGTNTLSKSVTISILPYKPELGLAKIKIIEASNYNLNDYPNNVNDGNLSSKWSVNGDYQWLTISLAEPFRINHIQIALLPDQKYESYFDIYASKDNLNWEPILIKTASCNFSGDLQNFNFPLEKTSTEYNFVKLVGHGNSLNAWNNYSEIKLFGSTDENSTGPIVSTGNITIYPNPASELINVLILEPPSESQLFRIYDMIGALRFESQLDPGVNNVQIPINLNSGVYIVEVLLGRLIIFTQKLFVIN